MMRRSVIELDESYSAVEWIEISGRLELLPTIEVIDWLDEMAPGTSYSGYTYRFTGVAPKQTIRFKFKNDHDRMLFKLAFG